MAHHKFQNKLASTFNSVLHTKIYVRISPPPIRATCSAHFTLTDLISYIIYNEEKNHEARHYLFISFGLDVFIKHDVRKNLPQPLSVRVLFDLRVSTVTLERKNLHTLTLRLLMSYIYGAPILDVSRSHTTTQHSR